MSESEFDRGHVAGQIEARLAGHDRHFAAINGSLGRIAEEIAQMTLALQRLGDQAVSRDATVLTTASALKDAEEARRDKSQQTWTPWTRVFAVIAALATGLSIWLALHPS